MVYCSVDSRPDYLADTKKFLHVKNYSMKSTRIYKWIEPVLILFGIFIIYQIIKVILGGSWTTEDIIISLLVFNLGSIFTIGWMVAELKSSHRHLGSQFKSLAEDFKNHIHSHKK